MSNLAKSIFSFSWAMSLFGVQQAANALAPSKAAKTFDHVTQSAREELGEALTAAFEAGDKLQKGVVDLTASAFKAGSAFDPSSVTRTAADLGRQTAQAFGGEREND